MLAALDAQAKHTVTFDLEADDTHFVLTEALREFAARERWQAKDDDADGESRTRWAGRAEAMIDLIEKACEGAELKAPARIAARRRGT